MTYRMTRTEAECRRQIYLCAKGYFLGMGKYAAPGMYEYFSNEATRYWCALNGVWR